MHCHQSSTELWGEGESKTADGGGGGSGRVGWSEGLQANGAGCMLLGISRLPQELGGSWGRELERQWGRGCTGTE